MKQNKKFVISNIHGNYDQFVHLLMISKYDMEKDELYVLGDMIDSGPDSGKVLKLLWKMDQEYENVHILKGEHEEMMCMKMRHNDSEWYEIGGMESEISINKAFKYDQKDKMLKWVESLPLIIEDEDYIYTHAGFSRHVKGQYENKKNLLNTYEDIYRTSPQTMKYYTDSKIMIHGHIPTRRIEFDGVRLSIDTGAYNNLSGKLSLLELNNNISYEYDFERNDIQIKVINNVGVANT